MYIVHLEYALLLVIIVSAETEMHNNTEKTELANHTLYGKTKKSTSLES